MIAIAIGRPKPSAPKIVRANSKTKFASGRTLGSDITLLLGAPLDGERLWQTPVDSRILNFGQGCSTGGTPGHFDTDLFI